MSSASESNAGSDSDAVVIDHDDVSNYNPGQLLPQSPKILRAIRAWLQPTAYDIAGGEYKKHLASHAPGTGAWLTSSPVYRQWLDGDEHGLLWLRGIPGSGKSVMAASLIDGMAKANPGCPVLFFFFRQIIDANHAPEALLRDWLDQLLDYSPPLQKTLADYVKEVQGVDSVSADDLWKDLRMALARLPGKVFCVGDALDEMDRGHDAFLEALGALGKWRPEKVKVLITSRPVPTVEIPLRKVPCLRLRLEENLVDVDISTYVRHSLASSTIPEINWKTIEDAVPGRANGLFLYAKLAMDAFLEPGARIENVLRHLPLDLNALYTGHLDEHAKRSGVEHSIQRLILQSVTHAARPLRLLELAEMIRVCGPGEAPLELKAAKDLIRSACGPLLEVLPDETVSVVHHSLTEYLKGTTRGDDTSGYRVLEKGPTHADLALVCLEYLQGGCLEKAEPPRGSGADPWGHFTGDQSEVSTEEARLRLQHPFFEYAASNWHRHAVASRSAGREKGRINGEIRKFLGGQLMEKWLAFRWGSRREGVSQVHVAARLGLVSRLKDMIGSMEVDVPDADGKTPLWWAAYEGCAESLRELIAAGANPDHDDGVEGLKPLHQAAQRNHGEAAKALLEAGVDPLTPRTRDYPGTARGNAPSAEGQTPLMYACEGGHLEAAEAFLPFLKDPFTLHRALGWAAAEGQSKVVALILRHPDVDPNAKVNGDTPLYAACCTLDPHTVKALLRAGADPNLESPVAGWLEEHRELGVPAKPRRYPLHAICSLNCDVRDPGDEEELFDALVEAGADISRQGYGGWTPLHGAVSPVLTRLLLDAGSDANATDSHGRTPLHMIPKVDTMELLFQLGSSDVNQKDSEGMTPLLRMAGASATRGDDIPKLLEYGADCNAANDWGDTALHILLRGPTWATPKVVPMLLASGADPNARNREGLTPLLATDTESPFFVVLLDMLLEAGADINAEDRKGATMLFNMMDRRCLELVAEAPHGDMKRLLDRGARASVADRDGRTLLHKAVQTCEGDAYKVGGGPYDKRVELVLSLGMEPSVVDRHGNGLLHEVALRDENHHLQHAGAMTTLWEARLGTGLDLQQKNHAGQTPLHVLCAGYTALSFWVDQVRPGETIPIDLVIARTEDLEVQDNDGNTPLHLAASTSLLYTKKLLDAGADPAAATFEGLTPLHVAARDGRSNTIGFLLDALRKRRPIDAGAPKRQAPAAPLSSDSQARTGTPVPGVNASLLRCSKLDPHSTPLHLACQSGRPESVRLLLAGGGSPSEGNIFVSCARFEPVTPSREGIYHAGLLPEETARIPEILDMLVEHGADVSLLEVRGSGVSPLGQALKECGQHVAGCFADARQKYLGGNPAERDVATGLAFSEHVQPYVVEAARRALVEFEPARSEEHTRNLLRHLMARRDYYLIEELARIGTPFLPNHFVTLIQHGFASLVDKIGSVEAAAALEGGDWHAHGHPSRPGLWYAKRDVTTDVARLNPTPFVLAAVHSELPNMEVLRLLVEKFAVDVNEVHHKPTNSRHGGKTERDESALHYVARGTTWWHVRQALPYLVAKGADLEGRGGKGRTPLQVALSGGHPFSREAAEALMAAGADVDADAGTDAGGSYLSCAQHDVPMLELLVARGAAVTPHALFAAIGARNVPALRVLLSSPGADPNAHLEGPPGKVRLPPRLLREVPLLRAAGTRSLAMGKAGGHVSEVMEAYMEMIRVLLEHGADPFARFQKRAKTGAFEEASLAREGEEYVELTLLHHLFRNAYLVDAFLEAPGLDVNHRNAEGQTLLHVACCGYRGLDYIVGSKMGGGEGVSVYRRLRDLGADVEARDNHGRTVLHAIATLNGISNGTKNTASLGSILAEAPGLAEQADRQGRTPLHQAIRSAAAGGPEPVIARALLSSGADAHAVDNEGDTVLHVLARNLDSPALRTLFEELVGVKGLDPNARNNKGETPLFAFARRRRGWSSYRKNHLREEYTEDEAIPLLQRLGVDFYARDDEGRGALHSAAEGDVDRFRELQGLGLDGMAEDDGGIMATAVDVAAAYGNREILELFEKGE